MSHSYLVVTKVMRVEELLFSFSPPNFDELLDSQLWGNPHKTYISSSTFPYVLQFLHFDFFLEMLPSVITSL